MRNILGKAGFVIAFAGLMVFILFPIFWILLMSFKDYADVIAYPPRFFFTPGGSADFRQYLLNSVMVSGGAVLLSLLVGVPAAFALSRNRIKGGDHLAFTFLSFRFAPELAVIIPLYALFQRVNLYDSYIGLILAHQLITIPLVIWIVRTFLADVPVEIEEAAQLDGCGPWRMLWLIVAPVIRPGIASAAILAFIFSWNNLLMGLVLSGPNTRPVTVGIMEAIGFDQVRWGWMAAAAMIAAVPGMIIAVYLQRHIISGLTAAIVK
jgi:multiple sugar transport system permease protein